MKRITVAAAVLVLSVACVSAQPMVPGPMVVPLVCVRLSEVMPNPGSGTDDGEEFIELWNFSETRSIDISSWRISDGEDSDSIVDYTGAYDLGESGLVIPPNGFALIVEGDYTGCYNSFIQNYAAPCSFIMVSVDDNEIGNILADSGDNITVTTAWTNPITGGAYSLAYSWGDTSAHCGDSIERDRYDSSTWLYSTDPNGSTPCVLNSYN